MNGKVDLPIHIQYPPQLRNLFEGDDANSLNFKTHIRLYNNLFAFASFQAQLRPPPGQLYVPIFRISGQVYHRTGPLHPPPNRAPTYNQLYIYDGAEAVQHRVAGNIFRQAPLSEGIVDIIQRTLDRLNPYAHLYKHAYEQEQQAVQQANENGLEQPRVRIVFHEGVNRRRENRPQINEVAAIFVGQDGAPPPRQTVVYSRNENVNKSSNLITPSLTQ